MTKQGQVLVVDDTLDFRRMLKRILQFYDLGVLEAQGGQQALALAGLERPDLILMDLNMPEMDGFETTRQLKRLPTTRHIPVVAVSAHCSDPRQREKVLAAGCVDCLDKPMEMEKVLALLKNFWS